MNISGRMEDDEESSFVAVEVRKNHKATHQHMGDASTRLCQGVAALASINNEEEEPVEASRKHKDALSMRDTSTRLCQGVAALEVINNDIQYEEEEEEEEDNEEGKEETLDEILLLSRLCDGVAHMAAEEEALAVEEEEELSIDDEEDELEEEELDTKASPGSPLLGMLDGNPNSEDAKKPVFVACGMQDKRALLRKIQSVREVTKVRPGLLNKSNSQRRLSSSGHEGKVKRRSSLNNDDNGGKVKRHISPTKSQSLDETKGKRPQRRRSGTTDGVPHIKRRSDHGPRKSLSSHDKPNHVKRDGAKRSSASQSRRLSRDSAALDNHDNTTTGDKPKVRRKGRMSVDEAAMSKMRNVRRMNSKEGVEDMRRGSSGHHRRTIRRSKTLDGADATPAQSMRAGSGHHRRPTIRRSRTMEGPGARLSGNADPESVDAKLAARRASLRRRRSHRLGKSEGDVDAASEDKKESEAADHLDADQQEAPKRRSQRRDVRNSQIVQALALQEELKNSLPEDLSESEVEEEDHSDEQTDEEENGPETDGNLNAPWAQFVPNFAAFGNVTGGEQGQANGLLTSMFSNAGATGGGEGHANRPSLLMNMNMFNHGANAAGGEQGQATNGLLTSMFSNVGVNANANGGGEGTVNRPSFMNMNVFNHGPSANATGGEGTVNRPSLLSLVPTLTQRPATDGATTDANTSTQVASRPSLTQNMQQIMGANLTFFQKVDVEAMGDNKSINKNEDSTAEVSESSSSERHMVHGQDGSNHSLTDCANNDEDGMNHSDASNQSNHDRDADTSGGTATQQQAQKIRQRTRMRQRNSTRRSAPTGNNLNTTRGRRGSNTKHRRGLVGEEENVPALG